MSTYIHKSHNVSVLIYHLFFPAKYRRVVFDEAVDKTLNEICLEISKRYEVVFLEIETDLDHKHFLIQSIPTYSPTKIVKMVKGITRKIFSNEHLKSKISFMVENFGQKDILSPQSVVTVVKI